jgi:hypothetical protein
MMSCKFTWYVKNLRDKQNNPRQQINDKMTGLISFRKLKRKKYDKRTDLDRF